MPLRLDKSRDYSTVHGGAPDPDVKPEILPKFVQDGWPFDNDGEIMEVLLTPEQKEKHEKIKERDAVRAKKGGGKEEKKEEKRDPTEINLQSWAEGKEKYPPHQISAALRERFHVNVTSIPDMIELLVKEKVVEVANLASQFKPQD